MFYNFLSIFQRSTKTKIFSKIYHPEL